MIRPVLACLIFGCCATTTLADDAATSPVALDLAIVSGEQLARAELILDADGRDYATIWNAKFQSIFDYCDVDQDKALSEKECRRLPSARALRESVSSGFAPVIGEAPTLAEVDLNADGKGTVEELAAYYRGQRIGDAMLGIGAAPFSAELTASLLEKVDLDHDGQVTEAEWLQAEKILPSLDQNDDELLGAGEVVAGIFYPGASGNLMRGAPRADDRPLPNSLAKFPLVVLPRDRKDGVWMKEVAALRGSESIEPLATWREEAADVKLELAIGAPADAPWTIQAVSTRPEPGSDLLRWKIGSTWVTLRTESGRQEEYGKGIRENVTERFKGADKDNDQKLSKEEWSAAERGGFGSAMIALLDADEDQVVTQAELDAWFALQREIGAAQVMVTAIDCGPGLFELLDYDRNGALSRRELRDAWSRIEAAGAVDAGAIQPEKLPRQLLLTVSLGQPTSPLGKIERVGPAWFLAMDRNGDGDVSRREFVGPASAFDGLDRNRDALISAGEVEAGK